MNLGHDLTLPRPGPAWGALPRRQGDDVPTSRRGAFGWMPGRRAARVAALALALQPRWTALFEPCTDARPPRRAAVLDAALGMLRARLRREGLTPQATAEALACACACAARTLGLDARANQRLAAAALVDGVMAEMATGEGKTLAIGLGAACGALAGVPVHVATANAYLAARDARSLAPFFDALGLRACALAEGEDETHRRAAYGQDVVYATAKELAFDHLRDRAEGLVLHDAKRAAAALAGRPAPPSRQRGLCMAILDEADSLLLDEADVPLILARQAPHAARRAFLWQALALARSLALELDVVIEPRERQAHLTSRGEDRLAALALPLGGPWQRPRYRREAVLVALVALHALRRDADYIVRDGRIEILDEVTGRVALGRQWSRGLHVAVSLKEGLAAPAETEVVAQITFQRFFRRYWRLGGVSGTLREARAELFDVYGARFVSVPPHAGSRRIDLPERRLPDAASLHAELARQVLALHAQARPVLIGTDDVAQSEGIAAVLRSHGLDPAVLNALHDAEEAAIVARAGEAGRITVATRMAGRGTDIALDTVARAAGGLHVISCQRNPSRRLDRQLAGRAARGGDPGSTETWAIAPLSKDSGGPLLPTLATCTPYARTLVARIARWTWRLAQAREERRRAARRRALLREDLSWNRRLAFAGQAE